MFLFMYLFFAEKIEMLENECSNLKKVYTNLQTENLSIKNEYSAIKKENEEIKN